jgi:group I intron endonuclease
MPYQNFSLKILEYCEVSDLLIREKHYWNLLQPEYNICLDPSAPFLGRKHTGESIQIMSEAKKGENNPKYGKTGEASPLFGTKLSDGTKNKISDALTGENHPMYGKPKPEGAGMSSQVIEVFDNKNNKTTTYESIRAAARDLEVDMSIITNYFSRNQQKPYKGRYTFITKSYNYLVAPLSNSLNALDYFIYTNRVFLMSSCDLVSMFLAIELQSYGVR